MNQTSTRLQPATPSRRIAAFLIDSSMQFILLIVMAMIFSDLQFSSQAIVAGLMVLSAAYSIGFIGITSSTPGKMAMGMWVSDASGQRVLPDRAILRYLVLALPNLTILYPIAWYVVAPVLLIVNLVMLFMDGQRRLLHDRIAGTYVINGRPPELY